MNSIVKQIWISCFHSSNSHSRLLTHWQCDVTFGLCLIYLPSQSGTWIRYNGFKPSRQNKPPLITTDSDHLATTDFHQHTVRLVSVWHVGQHWVCLWELVMNRKCFIILKAHFIAKRINHNSLLSAAYNWLFPWIINTWM